MCRYLRRYHGLAHHAPFAFAPRYLNVRRYLQCVRHDFVTSSYWQKSHCRDHLIYHELILRIVCFRLHF